MGVRYVHPLRELGPYLLGVEKPARYVGGEYGCLAKDPADTREKLLRMLIAFPDLYEIGMSNQALRILYNRLNGIPGISCDRAFAPAPDFEALLKERALPLYGLDTGISLGDLDLLCFTLGYELGITGVLTMLDAAGIPLRAAERGNGDPIVIMGGPCVSNPRPYQNFIDAFWIGEAEEGFFDLAAELAEMKRAGEGRGALLARMLSHPSVWAAGKDRAVRAVDTQFAVGKARAAVFPVPSMKVVQHHGAVEIMRGCPNGCRFCHAGIWYRPMRQKSAARIREEAAAFVETGGYRELSLSSLSTGDYRHIDALAESLNREYAPRHISFQLPSLRVSSFSLPLLEKVSAVRKSGLTFAVETPVDAWQLAVNKRVCRDNVIAILREARKNGWRGAKFYFMVGLPPGESGGSREEEEIAGFVLEAARQTGLHFNVNVGTFIPKPHTPYQWAAQIDEGAARKKLEYIRGSLKSRGHRVGLHDPFMATLEGFISRGDERVGEVLEEAFWRGCRLDAWDEYANKDIWRSLLEKNAPLLGEILGRREGDKPLPWDCVDSGTAAAYLKSEKARSEAAAETPPCGESCGHPCGVCPEFGRVRENRPPAAEAVAADFAAEAVAAPAEAETEPRETAARNSTAKRDAETHRIIFSFSKEDGAVFLPHLALIEVFSMALLRADLPVLYSRGFNPLPVIDFAAPLAIGISAAGEIATLDTQVFCAAEAFKTALNSRLPPGIAVREAQNARIPPGAKKHSAPSLLWGAVYEDADTGELFSVKAGEEKAYRAAKTGAGGNLFGLRRKTVLARPLDAAEDGPGVSYFSVYRSLYPDS